MSTRSGIGIRSEGNLAGSNDICCEKIVFCKAEGSYTNIYLDSGKRKIVSLNLKAVEGQLPSKEFCRCHHSYLINVNMVTGYDVIKNTVTLLEKHLVPISRRKRKTSRLFKKIHR
jgi:two-component system, LytTR family, response regulator